MRLYPEQLSKVHADSRGGGCSMDSVTDIENRMVQLEEKLNKMTRHELQSEAITQSVLGNLESIQMISNLVSIERESAWLGLINAVRSKMALVKLTAASSRAPIIHGPVSKSDTDYSTGDIVEKSRLVLQVMEGNVHPQKIFIIVEENDSTGPTALHQIHRIADAISQGDLGFRPDLFAIFTSSQVPETILDSMKTRT